MQSIKPHIAPILLLLLSTFAYFSPVFQGKELKQHDVVQSGAMGHEVKTHYEKTGEISRWTGTMFSGMPSDQIWPKTEYNLSNKLYSTLNVIFPKQLRYPITYMLVFYLFLIVIGCSPWLAAAGAVAFGFSTYNVIIIEAGHLSKVSAIGFAPGILAGIYLVVRRNKLLLGAGLTALFLALEITSNHVQITYYLAFVIAFWLIAEAIVMFQSQQTIPLVKKYALLLSMVIIAVLPSTTLLWTTYDYSKETIRGEQELSDKKIDGNGLSKDYALSWSMDKLETFATLIPNVMGGASGGKLDKDSETYDVLTSRGVPARQAEQFISSLPLYWGSQPFTSGPGYFGAVVIFLFVLALFTVKREKLIWPLIATIFCLFISWGRNLQWFYDIFFNYFPMFNKFRSPNMMIALVNIMVLWIAFLGLRPVAKGDVDIKSLKKKLLYSLYVTGGICVFFAIAGPSMFDFQSPNDSQLLASLTQSTGDKGFAESILSGVIDDRGGLMSADAWRSFIFVALTFGLLFFGLSLEKFKTYVFPILAILILVDLYAVDKRYLNEDDFTKPRRNQNALFQPTPADQFVMNDKDEHFRVLNLSVNTFNDASKAMFYKNIGGYHAAKLKRYQDLIERRIQPEIQQLRNGFSQTPVLNMLNTKYVILGNQPKDVMSNSLNLGEAWFAPSIQWVDNADQEMAALETFDPKTTAVIDQEFRPMLDGFEYTEDPRSVIYFTSYSPNEIRYTSKSETPQVAIFSEIYYKGDEFWKVTIDGKEAQHFRANYVLRGMLVPPGEHEIVFRYEPTPFIVGEKISLAGSILLLIMILAIPYALWRERKNEVSEANDEAID